MNIQNALFIVAAAVLGIVVQRLLGWSIPQVFLALAIANALVAICIFTLVPEFLMRFLSWVLVRTLYRLRVHGIEEHVPDEGAGAAGVQPRQLHGRADPGGAHPAAGALRDVLQDLQHPGDELDLPHRARRSRSPARSEDPALMQRAFDEIDAALADGEMVGIFPEGALTQDGEIAPFKSGVERILARSARCRWCRWRCKGMWASMWSRRDSRLGRMRVPRRFRAHVEVVAGPPIAGEQRRRHCWKRRCARCAATAPERVAPIPASADQARDDEHASTASHSSRMRQTRLIASRSSSRRQAPAPAVDRRRRLLRPVR